MKPKKRVDPDRRTDTPFTPFDVLRGEWWEDRKRELAKMNRAQLTSALADRDITAPGPEPNGGALLSHRYDSMLWMRLRLAGEEQIEFHTERTQPVPASMRPALDLMDRTPGWVPTFRTNIFYDVDGEAAAKAAITKQNNAIEAAIMADTQGEKNS